MGVGSRLGSGVVQAGFRVCCCSPHMMPGPFDLRRLRLPMCSWATQGGERGKLHTNDKQAQQLNLG